MATRIGCSDFVYAALASDEISSLTYDTVKKAPGVMSININPNPTQETLFTDDGPSESATTLGNITVEVQKNAFDTQQRADLLGHKIDGNGALIYAADDVPPWVAIGFRTLKSNGTYRYVWLLKGKFTEPEDNNETKGDTINFQSETMTGQFVHTIRTFNIDNKAIKPWKYELDQEADNVNQTLLSGWFTNVQQPSEIATVPTTVYLTYSSAGVAADQKITGLNAGKKFTIEYNGQTYFVNANGAVGESTATGNAVALIGTEITGLTNGETYHVRQLN